MDKGDGSRGDMGKGDGKAFKRGLRIRGGVDEWLPNELFWLCMGNSIDDPASARGGFMSGGAAICMSWLWLCHH